MNIYNSLGSNYRKKDLSVYLKVLLNALAEKKFPGAYENLEKKFKQQFGKTSVVLTYKGRHGISLALENLGLRKGDTVFLQAFTCWAVEEAIQMSGLKPVFVDIGENGLNLSLKTIKEAYKSNPDVKAIILQHTFGFQAESKKISEWSKSKGIFLIEDLAHAYGSLNAGVYGDAVALSFGRDKIIDAVSGGACISNQTISFSLQDIKKNTIIVDLLYPFVTMSIRGLYPVGFGKILHWLLKKTPLLSSPIANSYPKTSQLPPSHAQLCFDTLRSIDAQISHRKQIATIYQQRVDSRLQLPNLPIDSAACLRFPLRVSNRNTLINALKKHGVYLADTWFRQPVEKGKLDVHSQYQSGSCPKAEDLSSKIFNLPTHVNINSEQAIKLSELINKYAKYD